MLFYFVKFSNFNDNLTTKITHMPEHSFSVGIYKNCVQSNKIKHLKHLKNSQSSLPEERSGCHRRESFRYAFLISLWSLFFKSLNSIN